MFSPSNENTPTDQELEFLFQPLKENYLKLMESWKDFNYDSRRNDLFLYNFYTNYSKYYPEEYKKILIEKVLLDPSMLLKFIRMVLLLDSSSDIPFGVRDEEIIFTVFPKELLGQVGDAIMKLKDKNKFQPTENKIVEYFIQIIDNINAG